MRTEETQEVIVVEHDNEVLVRLQILLQTGPYRVLLAKSIKKAERLIRNLESPCILLLENDLPEGKGVDFIPKLLRLSRHVITPILLCQEDTTELRVAAMDAGAKYTYPKKDGYKLFFLQVEEVRKQIQDQQRGKVDPLTSIYSQGYGLELAAKELDRICTVKTDRRDRREQRERRTRRALSCLMFDLDSFKKINDTHGHSVGNEALKTAVTSAKKHLRRGDIFWRAGGDEFMILLPGLAQKRAEERAHLITDEVSRATFGGGLELSVSASIGVATLRKQDIDTKDPRVTLQRLLHRADIAMYEVKRERKGK